MTARKLRESGWRGKDGEGANSYGKDADRLGWRGKDATRADRYVEHDQYSKQKSTCLCVCHSRLQFFLFQCVQSSSCKLTAESNWGGGGDGGACVGE